MDERGKERRGAENTRDSNNRLFSFLSPFGDWLQSGTNPILLPTDDATKDCIKQNKVVSSKASSPAREKEGRSKFWSE